MVGRDDHIASSVIILNYFDVAFLEVNIDYVLPTGIKDFFLFFLMYHSEPFSRHIFF